MNRKLKIGIVLLGLGCASFTWLLLFMHSQYPAAFFGMLSKSGHSFSLAAAPPWLWGGLAIALLLVVKGATGVGRGMRKDDDE